jgi:hypothetical protein
VFCLILGALHGLSTGAFRCAELPLVQETAPLPSARAFFKAVSALKFGKSKKNTSRPYRRIGKKMCFVFWTYPKNRRASSITNTEAPQMALRIFLELQWGYT